ncbi:hypothetical protein U1Q18_012667, partial [Sarracenia purpurea var. burkii]
MLKKGAYRGWKRGKTGVAWRCMEVRRRRVVADRALMIGVLIRTDGDKSPVIFAGVFYGQRTPKTVTEMCAVEGRSGVPRMAPELAEEEDQRWPATGAVDEDL